MASELEKLSQKELELAERLKLFCTPLGDERESQINQSTEVLLEMGVLYTEKAQLTEGIHQKMNYIKAAALLHGARVRCEKYMEDFGELTKSKVSMALIKMTKNLLQSCNARLPNESLMQISLYVSRKLNSLRREERSVMCHLRILEDDLEDAVRHQRQEQKIRHIGMLLEHNTKNYKLLMQHVSARCIDILEDSPCAFAIVGLGSLARKEITLYSDFEHVIVLPDDVPDWPEYPEIKEYFRWFTVIFQIIIIGLGETFIRSVGVKSLNDLYTDDKTKNWFYDMFTPSGVSFDGQVPHSCNNPLGRTEMTKDKRYIVELIQPANMMAKYLSTDEQLKNGYYLKDILVRTCFVYGDADVYTKFRQHCGDILKEQKFEDMVKELGEILHKNVNMNMQAQRPMLHPDNCDMKQYLYRPLTAYLAWQGRLNGFMGGSAFEYLSKYQHLYSEKFLHEIRYAFAVACEIRAKTYARGGHQRQKVNPNLVTSFVGKRCFSDCLVTTDILLFILIEWSNASGYEGIKKVEIDENMKLIMKKRYSIQFHNNPTANIKENLSSSALGTNAVVYGTIQMYLEKLAECETNEKFSYATQIKNFLSDFMHSDSWKSNVENNSFYYSILAKVHFYLEQWMDLLRVGELWFEIWDQDKFPQEKAQELQIYILNALINTFSPKEAVEYLKEKSIITSGLMGNIMQKYMLARLQALEENSSATRANLLQIFELCQNAITTKNIYWIAHVLHSIFLFQIYEKLPDDAHATLLLRTKLLENQRAPPHANPKHLTQCFLKLAALENNIEIRYQNILCAFNHCKKISDPSLHEEYYSKILSLLLVSLNKPDAMVQYMKYIEMAPKSILELPNVKRKITSSLYKILSNYFLLNMADENYLLNYVNVITVIGNFWDYLTEPCFVRIFNLVIGKIYICTKVDKLVSAPMEFQQQYYGFLKSPRILQRKHEYEIAREICTKHSSVLERLYNGSEIKGNVNYLWKAINATKISWITKNKAIAFLFHLIIALPYHAIWNCTFPRLSKFALKHSIGSSTKNKATQEFNVAIQQFNKFRFEESAHTFWKIIFMEKNRSNLQKKSIEMLFHTIFCVEKNVFESWHILIIEQEEARFMGEIFNLQLNSKYVRHGYK